MGHCMASFRGRSDPDSMSRNGRSLLGLDDANNKRLLYAEESEDLFDRETENDLERMSSKANEMKNLSSAIEIEITESMRQIDEMNEGFSSVQSALDASFKRLKKLQKTASTRHMCYLILF